jgi:hypothetical protein
MAGGSCCSQQLDTGRRCGHAPGQARTEQTAERVSVEQRRNLGDRQAVDSADARAWQAQRPGWLDVEHVIVPAERAREMLLAVRSTTKRHFSQPDELALRPGRLSLPA